MMRINSSDLNLDSPVIKSKADLNDIYESVDFYSTYFHEDTVDLDTVHKSSLMYYFFSIRQSIMNFFYHTLKVDALTLLFLFLLGLSTSVVSTFVDYVISLLLESRSSLAISSKLHEWYFLNYLLWIAYSLFMSILAAATVHLISSHSSGSGIPEMKSILSGVVMREYLSFRTLCAKVIGLIATYASGFSVGKEGPFVHISGSVCQLLLRIPIFKDFRRNDFVRNQLLAAACAAGVSATFGAPFGGVLFSIEVTSTYYPVGNLWKGVFTSLIGSFFFFIFRMSGITSKATKLSLFSTTFEEIPDNIFEYFLFALLGVICGIVGALFVWIFTKFVYVRQNFSLIRKRRYVPVLLVCFITAAVSFPLPLINGSPQAVTQTLFSSKSISDDVPYLFLNLTISFISRFLLTAMAIVLPVPCGCFTPIFEIGATFGRLFGEVVNELVVTTIPGGYAVVGAAALSSAATGTLSTAIILFELTGQLKYMLPVLLSTCIAVGVANLFNLTIYDTILNLRGFPYLSLIDRREMQDKNFQHKTVQEIMRNCDDGYISMSSSVRQIEKILQETSFDVFPLVDSETSMLLIGSIQRGSLEKMIHRYKKRQERQMKTNSPTNTDHSPSFLGSVKFLIRSPSYYSEAQKKKRSESLEVGAKLAKVEDIVRHNVKDTARDIIESDQQQDDVMEKEDNFIEKTQEATSEDVQIKIDSHDTFNVKDVSILADEDVLYNEDDQSLTFSHSNDSLLQKPMLQHDVRPHIIMDKKNPRNRALSLGHVVPRFMSDIRMIHEEAQRDNADDSFVVQIDPAPFQISVLTPMAKVYFLFSMLGLSHAFVVSRGKLIGIVTRKDLIMKKLN